MSAAVSYLTAAIPCLIPSPCRHGSTVSLSSLSLSPPLPLLPFHSSGLDRLLVSPTLPLPLYSLPFSSSLLYSPVLLSTAVSSLPAPPGDEPALSPGSSYISASVPSPSPSLPPPSLPPPPSSPSSPSPPPSSPSSAPLHTTDWSDVSIPRFCLWMSVFSIAENFLFYPFYLIKTREQADRSTHYRALTAALTQVRHIVRKDGVKGFYRGFVASSFVSLPAYGIYSGVYTWAKGQLGYHAQTPAAPDPASPSFAARHPVLVSYAAPFLAGLVADVASIALYVPGDVIVQRLQLLNSPYSSFPDACRRIWKDEGAAGFFRGFGATFFTSAIASAVWWMIYEQSKSRLYAWDERRKAADPTPAPVAGQGRGQGVWAAMTEVNRMPQLMAGFLAGTLTSTLINPLDVVKTRLQVQDSQVGGEGGKKPYRNFVHGLRQVYVEEGLKGYVRGLVPKLLSRGPLSAASSLMYELVLYLSREEKPGQLVAKLT